MFSVGEQKLRSLIHRLNFVRITDFYGNKLYDKIAQVHQVNQYTERKKQKNIKYKFKCICKSSCNMQV